MCLPYFETFPGLLTVRTAVLFWGNAFSLRRTIAWCVCNNKEMVSRLSLVHFLIPPLYMVRIKQGKGQLLWWK